MFQLKMNTCRVGRNGQVGQCQRRLVLELTQRGIGMRKATLRRPPIGDLASEHTNGQYYNVFRVCKESYRGKLVTPSKVGHTSLLTQIIVTIDNILLVRSRQTDNRLAICARSQKN
jgi:hypothetical protein